MKQEQNQIFKQVIPLALATGSVGIGAGALVAPVLSSRMYGAPTNEEGFVKASGVRDFFIGLTIFELWRERQTRLLALSIGALSIVSLGDAYVTWTSGNRRRTPMHLAGAVFSGICAAVLLSEKIDA